MQRVQAKPDHPVRAGSRVHERGLKEGRRRGPAAAATPEPLTGLARRLLREGIVGRDALHEAVRASREQSVSLVACLVSTGRGDPARIAVAAAREFGVPALDLDAVQPGPESSTLIPAELLRQHRVLPLMRRGRRVFVGIADPTNLRALDDIEFQTSLRPEPVIVEHDKLEARIGGSMGAEDASAAAFDFTELDLDGLQPVEDGDDADPVNADVDDAPVVKFVNRIMLDCVNRGASDIHFEPYERMYRIRMRHDGVLSEIAHPPMAVAGRLAARLKVMARLNVAERRMPQDGRIRMRVAPDRAIDLRVNTCPTLFGEKVVCRLLDPDSVKTDINDLGYEEGQKKTYLDHLARPHGMILVTGPTGSGKTVSLYAGLNTLNTSDRNIATAEDPAEINLPGINQVNVNPKVGLTFASCLRAFLRQDPDIIMVGEIRDLETAQVAIRAAQTGHLVLSTLHTNDAPRTLTRLVDMGIKPYAIASSVSLIIAQRLARTLCGACKQPAHVPADALIQEGFSPEEVEAGLTTYAARGCNRCSAGYRGRTGVFQVMPVSEPIGRIMMDGGNATQIARQAAAEGIRDVRRSALAKVRRGLIGLEELNRITVD